MNKTFYPTPKNIIKKMVDDISNNSDSNKLRILEPSAGKGDILDYITDNNHYNIKLFVIEKDPNLQAILRSKNYNIIDTDFLTYNPDCTFDYIIMNPPFDNGVKHFLKAWEIASNTTIKCLLNASAINNAFSEERKLIMKIVEDNNGTIEKLGSCFMDAERKTNVDTILITVHKKQKTEYSFEFKKQYDKEKQYNINDINNTDVANVDVFGNMEVRYNKVRELFKNMIELKNEIQYYASDMLTVHPFAVLNNDNSSNDNETYNNVCDELRKDAWNNIFKTTKLNNITTTKTQKRINEIQEKQGYMAFTANNMENVYQDLAQNLPNIMNDCVVESFDLITKYYNENRHYIEGWKTNERFFVNSKFILPMCVDPFYTSYNDYVHVEYRAKENITDIEKALCYITNKKIGECTTIESLANNRKITEYGKWYTSEFFDFKCFKKGTMHFKFKDEILWTKFNKIACKGKNWLGFDYKTT